jgi:hypothetical protein
MNTPRIDLSFNSGKLIQSWLNLRHMRIFFDHAGVWRGGEGATFAVSAALVGALKIGDPQRARPFAGKKRWRAEMPFDL